MDHKKKRINWIEFISFNGLYPEFSRWLKSRNRKIKSLNRLGYLFLKTKMSSDDIRFARDHFDMSEIVRIIKTPWIKLQED